MKEYRIGKVFAQDHWDRGCGENDVIVRENGVFYIVRLDEAGYKDMLTDADYYWDMRKEMSEWGGGDLCKAAKRTYDALVKQGPPA